MDPADWAAESEQTGAFFGEVRRPLLSEELRDEHAKLGKRLGVVAGVTK